MTRQKIANLRPVLARIVRQESYGPGTTVIRLYSDRQQGNGHNRYVDLHLECMELLHLRRVVHEAAANQADALRRMSDDLQGKDGET